MGNYEVIRSSVLNKHCLTAVYEQRIRHFSPHCLGKNRDGGFSVLAFQYGGQSSKLLPPEGQWRCFGLQSLTGIHINADNWHTGHDHDRPNTCVRKVDVDAR
jgi:hypothetical protein